MAGGMMQKLIERNSTIPTNKSQAGSLMFFGLKSSLQGLHHR